jgi:hypothetical protein
MSDGVRCCIRLAQDADGADENSGRSGELSEDDSLAVALAICPEVDPSAIPY